MQIWNLKYISTSDDEDNDSDDTESSSEEDSEENENSKPDINSKLEVTSNQEASLLVGQILGQKAIAKNLSKVVFDRGNRPYHGRIKSVAEGARNAGLIF